MTTTNDKTVLETLFLICAVLSVLGSFSIIFGTLFFRHMSKTVYSIRLVTFISLADLCGALSCIAGIIGNDYFKSKVFCSLQASGLQYFYLSSFFWTTCFAHSLYLYVSRKETKKDVKKYEILYHLICWITPSFTVIWLLVGEYFGETGTWCWIAKQHETYRFAFFYFPLWALMCINVFLYLLVLRAANTPVIAKKVAWFVVVFLLCWLPGTLHRIYEWFTGRSYFWMDAVHGSSIFLQGFFNCLVYGWTIPALRDNYRLWILTKNGRSSNSRQHYSLSSDDEQNVMKETDRLINP